LLLQETAAKQIKICQLTQGDFLNDCATN